jgi:hypothetical protein
MPTPVRNRAIPKIHQLPASPDSAVNTLYTTTAMIIVRRRPRRSPTMPPMIPPVAHPASVIATR